MIPVTLRFFDLTPATHPTEAVACDESRNRREISADYMSIIFVDILTFEY